MNTEMFVVGSLAGTYVYGTALEWFVHNTLYHQVFPKLGRRWAYHLREHHVDTRRQAGLDGAFEAVRFRLDAHTRELLGLGLIMLLHLPLLWFSPVAYATLGMMAARYHYFHRRCHLSADWCRTYAPWHWEHHMGKTGNANYCMTSDWFDKLMGTRRRFPELFGA